MEDFTLIGKTKLDDLLQRKICHQATFHDNISKRCIAELIQKEVLPHLTCDGVELLTRVKMDIGVFYGHPSFHGGEPWNDWVYINYDNNQCIPAQIQIFVQIKDGTLQKSIHVNSTVIDQPGLYAIAYSLEQSLDDVPRREEWGNFRAHQSSRFLYWARLWLHSDGPVVAPNRRRNQKKPPAKMAKMARVSHNAPQQLDTTAAEVAEAAETELGPDMPRLCFFPVEVLCKDMCGHSRQARQAQLGLHVHSAQR